MANHLSTYAHLSSFAAGKRADEDEDNKNKNAAEDEDNKEKNASEDEENKEKDASEGGDDKGGDDKNKNAKNAKKADDDGDDADAEDEEDDKTMKAARRRERARCGRIFKSPLAAVNPAAAAHLAFDTGMSSKSALGILAATNAGMPKAQAPQQQSGRSRLDERMASVPRHAVGASVAESSPADRILAAGRKRRGEA